MREVAPGDVIFSFFDTRIAALGIARSYCYESPKPTEFGSAGAYWEAIGWKIDTLVLPASTERRRPAERLSRRSRSTLRRGALPLDRSRGS